MELKTPDSPKFNPNNSLKTYLKTCRKIDVEPTKQVEELTTKNAVTFLVAGTIPSKVCKYCLNVTEELYELERVMEIGSKGGLYSVTVRDMIASFHPFKIADDPNLPNKICNKCLDRTINSYLFAQQCDQAERAIVNCFEDINSKLSKLDPIGAEKQKRGRKKKRYNYDKIEVQHSNVIDYADPVMHIVNTASESSSTEPALNPLECLKCCQVLPTIESLVNHSKIHPKSMWYNCRLCGKSFPKLYLVKRHYREHECDYLKPTAEVEEKKFECKQCGETNKLYYKHIQHLEKHQFKMVIDHLVHRKMDKLCSICLDKGSLAPLNKMVCIHGGPPELMGDRTMQSILGSTLPEKKYKYQELYVANYAKIIEMPKRKLKNEAMMHNIPNPIISSTKTNRKDKNDEATYIFSAPLDALIINTVDTINKTNILAGEEDKFTKNILKGDFTINGNISTDSLGSDKNITKKRKHGDTEIHKPSKQRNGAGNAEVNCFGLILNDTLKANGGNIDGCRTAIYQSTPGSDIKFVKSCYYCWIFKSTKQCEYCKKYNKEISHNETIYKEFLKDSNKALKEVTQTNGGFLKASVTYNTLNNEAGICANAISFQSQSKNAQNHDKIDNFNSGTTDSILYLADTVEIATEFKKTHEQINSRKTCFKTSLFEMKNVEKDSVTNIDVNLKEAEIDFSTDHNEMFNQHLPATENTIETKITDLQNTENTLFVLETKIALENDSAIAIEEKAMIVNNMKNSDSEVNNNDEKYSITPKLRNETTYTYVKNEVTSNEKDSKFNTDTDDVEVTSYVEKDSSTNKDFDEEMDVDDTFEFMQLKHEKIATSPLSTLQSPHIPMQPPSMMDFTSMNFLNNYTGSKICEKCVNSAITSYTFMSHAYFVRDRLNTCITHMLDSLKSITPENNLCIEIAKNTIMPIKEPVDEAIYDDDIDDDDGTDDENKEDFLEDEYRVKSENESESELEIKPIAKWQVVDYNNRHSKDEQATDAKYLNGYQMDVCSEFLTFNKKPKLRKINKKFTCPKCNKHFISDYFVKRHILKHISTKVKCGPCGTKFGNKFSLNEHTKYAHVLFQSDYRACKTCGRGFAKAHKLKHHEKQHRNKVCPLCDKIFKTQSYFDTHMQRHVPKLIVLNKKYEQSCSFCEKECSNDNQLSLHVNKVHLQIKPYSCDMCDKQFYTAYNLRYHKKIHSKFSKEKCNFCSKTLKSRKLLVIHIRKHIGATPHICQICNQSYYSQTKLKKHMNLTHGGTFLCKVCKHVSVSKNELKKHVDKAHSFF